MNEAEARSILVSELEKYRAKSYSDLLYLLDRQECSEVIGPSGVLYQLEIQATWDAKPGEVLRVWGGIDDRGWRAFVPLTDGFLMAPDGTFVDE